MSNFDSTKLSLSKILDNIVEGKIQLPDFQRGWIWDDEHIRSLMVSLARSFPIGSIMLLEAGGDARFQIRPVEGLNGVPAEKVERLILDGQQRLTSLLQVLVLKTPVRTKTNRRDVERFYYFNIEKALEGSSSIEEALIGVDGSRILRSNFGRTIELDLSCPENEYQSFHFPCNQILDSDQWEEGLMAFDPGRFARYMDFRSKVLRVFRDYQVPIIELKKENSKEAVCLVFEKVNTGGVPLSVFELVTASYAADGFNLRDDWHGNRQRQIQGRKARLSEKGLLHGLQPTDFLQGVSLLHSYDRRQADLVGGRTGKDVTAVTAKREHVLAMPLDAYRTWADRLTDGFVAADRFLRQEGFHQLSYLPYGSQLVPLAAMMVHLGDRWLTPVVYGKLARWFWCGVFGELYGGALETRIALDLQDVLAWINQANAPEPATVIASGFQPSRLDTLRTRTSAAYRGLYVLLQREKARDFFWKAEITDLDRDEVGIDIHHIFPRDWCRKHGIEDRVANAIVNKTPISYKANRMIGSRSPSDYLNQLRNHELAAMTVAEQDEILQSHLIDPQQLREDDFMAFYEARRRALAGLVEKATGKSIITDSSEAPPEDAYEDERN
ncbi:MAG: DUF262 domain-containing protein [Nitrospira sp.]